jgi:hypothetical protein
MNTIRTNGGKIECDKDESIVIVAELITSHTSGATLTVEAGDFSATGQGNLDVALAANTPKMIGPLEGARFAQNDGFLYINMASAHTAPVGTLAALDLDF